MPNPNQEPPASSKAPNEGLKDMDVLCALKIKIESQNSDHGCVKSSDHVQIKIKMPNPSQEPKHPPKPQAVLKRYGCSLLFQKQDREPKVGTFVYQSQ